MISARRFRQLLLSISALTILGSAYAGESSDGAAFSDSDFLRKAAVAGLAEVALGQLALQKSANPAVQQFATRMVQDHTAQGAQLRRVAARIGVVVPARLDGRYAAGVQNFAALQGPQFEGAYVHSMVTDHEQMIQKFRDASTRAHHASVRAFAAASLPVLEQHLVHARSLLQQMQQAAAAQQGGGGVLVHRYPVEGLACPTYY